MDARLHPRASSGDGNAAAPLSRAHGWGDEYAAQHTTHLTRLGRCAQEQDIVRSTRLGFVQKTLGLVAAQLLLTAACCLLVVLNETARAYAISTWERSSWHTATSLAATFVFFVASFACSQSHPYNLLCLLLFTLASSWGIARVCALLYDAGLGPSIAQAAGFTAMATTGLALFAIYSKRNFSFLRAGLFVSLLVLCVSSTAALIGQYAGWSYPHVFHHALGVLLFSCYLLFDVHELSTTLGVDEYVAAAISIYLDVINLFLQLLSFLVELAIREQEESENDKR